MIAHMNTYGDNLEAALAKQISIELVERDMGQQDLAAAVGIEPATLSRYMNLKRSMPMPTFMKVAEALGINPATLMQRAADRVKPEAHEDQLPA